MTLPTQPPHNDPRRPSVPTSSLPLVGGGSPYGHHVRLPNLNSPQQQPHHHHQPPPPPPPPLMNSYASQSPYPLPYQSTPASPSHYNGPPVAAGLVTASSMNNKPPLAAPSLPLPSSPSSSATNKHVLPTSDYRNHIGSEVSPSSPSTSNGNSVEHRPLNVIDALAYLDQVKSRFSDKSKSNVYNKFLGIMKDFKSQTIDTPGVIDRVSTLFKGHPQLISGFNTFLPTGYRIECSVDPRDPNRIIVTTPDGNKTTSTTSTAEEMRNVESHYLPPPPPPPPPATDGHVHSNSIPATSITSSNTHLPPYTSYNNALITSPEHRPSSIAEASPVMSDRKPPVEFNHAINYVNRIKNRFAHNPDIYKQFLEILQTYQNEQKPIEEVYAHVRYLFNGADDLLEEFKQFLPEIGGESTHQQDTVSYDASTIPAKRKKTSTTTKRSKHSHHQDDDAMSYSNLYPPRPSVSADEVDLFDRIKRYLGNRPSYEEFLKTLNLYTQDIIGMDLLMVQVEGFLSGNKDLLNAFKYMVKYEPKNPPVKRPAVSVAKPDLNHCPAVKSSPSYRVVTREWQNQPCSGRDQMCWEVLNDEYASHPIWASEDSGFVASKKNGYEEALHRCEEERYEYDMNIEANLNTIALLKPIAARIEKMTPEEQRAMQLKPGLGGPTVSIYERIIKKVYDDERGAEIVEMMYSKPATVIPIVLKRLQIKDKEWKKAQREWNKLWRDVDMKNFYRSLDYQSNTFKTNDRKAMANKALIAEIETIQKQSKAHQPHLEYDFNDDGIFKDISRIICSFMDKQNGFTKLDKQRVRNFLRSFVPVFFHVEDTMPTEDAIEEGQKLLQQQRDDMHDQEDEEQASNTEDSDADTQSSSPVRRSASISATDESKNGTLLRDVFKRNNSLLTSAEVNDKKKEDEQDEDATTLSDEVIVPEHDDMKLKGEDKDFDLYAAAAAATAPEVISQKRVYSLLCSSHYYCLFRFYLTLYERLHKLKSASEHIKANPELGKKHNKNAVELDLVSNRFEDIDLSNGYYAALLDMIDSFFEGELDQGAFEENIRYVFGIDAYAIFTVDKVTQLLIKQIQTVTTDRKSNELLKLFSQNQVLEHSSAKTPSAYRSLVEGILESNENLYKISFNTDALTVAVQLLDRENELPVAFTGEELHEEYVASYVNWMHDTKGVDRALMKPSFLSRNLRPQDRHLEGIQVRSQLRYKIQQKTYHLYYIVGSEDLFYRPPLQQKEGDDNKNSWSSWLSRQGNDEYDAETRRLLNN